MMVLPNYNVGSLPHKSLDNPFRPSFGFRNAINDTNLSFGLHDQVSSITSRFSNGIQTSNRQVIPTPRTQAVGGRPNIPNFPVHVSKPTKSEVTNQNAIEKSRFPNFPTANLKTPSNIQNVLKQKTVVKPNIQNVLKQNTVVQPNIQNVLKQNTVVLPNIPNFPTAIGSQQLLSNRIVNPKGVVFNLNTPAKTGVASEPKAQGVNSITKTTATQTQDISSLETNSKNKKSTNSATSNGVGSNNNQLPIVSPGFNPLAQIANFMKNARLNSSGDAPVTFFIGPLLVPAHVLENAREDPSGRTVNSPLIALPFGPSAENSQSNAATSANSNSVRQRPSASSIVSPIATSAPSANRRTQSVSVTQTHQPIDNSNPHKNSSTYCTKKDSQYK
ncbi:hypothetical protein KUTeg_017568 [Tegillarca granosa]|uniref:Uncharacterized protein n=1 Tax=Tegillarca granosa TaxID=220873 RepID=A0ABQ9EKD5_TEGGR|nr:hypothetical protein KUTeg_017568 [Tegillarca granosa]